MSGSDPSSSERRQVTILHCDIVDSTYIIEHADPEDFQELIHEFVKICESAVNGVSGHMAGFTGDGIEAYFGHPVASENAPVDALLAAIAIQEQVGGIPVPIAEEHTLRVRIGVATGLVVTEVPTGPVAGKEVLAYGTPAHLAARLEAAAGPGESYVDSTTRNLTAPEFVFEEIGSVRFKGIEADQVVWRLIRHNPSVTRFRSESLTPFVGRTDELALLRESRDAALAGGGSVVIVSGDPGIGKSRLVYEALRQAPAGPGASLLSAQCSPRFSSTPLFPIISGIEQRCLLRAGDSAATRRGKVAAFLTKELALAERSVTTLLSMMELAELPTDASEVQSSQRLEQVTADLVDALLGATRHTPMILLIEDFHWADETSAELVDRLAGAIAGRDLLAVLTSRSVHDTLGERPGVRRIHLDRLSEAQTDELISELADGFQLQPGSLAAIRQRTDGNPLYVEEVTRTLVEQIRGVEQQLLATEVPSSLQNLLLERLDRLGSAKSVAQVAATIGREFSFEMLLAVDDGNEREDVEKGIEALVASGLVQRDGAKAERHYFFHHALFQEAAYESQLRSRRRAMHGRIARYLLVHRRRLERFRPELAAFHFDGAREHPRAFRYWVKAGAQALEAGATTDAVRILDNARTLLGRLGSDARSLVLKLRYYLLLGKALNASLGARSDEAVNAFRQAGKICTRLGPAFVSKRIHALDSEFGIIYNSGGLEASLGPAREMIEVGGEEDDEVGTICGQQSVGMALFMQGRLAQAKGYLEEAVRDHEGVTVGINSYPSLALMFLSHVCYILNERERALELCASSIESGRRESRYSHLVSLGNSCYLYMFDGDLESMERSCGEMVELAEKLGQLMWLKRGLVVRHWLAANRDHDASALRQAVSLVEELLASKEEIDMPMFFSLLAQSEGKLGLFGDAVRHFLKAIEIAHRNQEKYYLPEIYRKYGDLLAATEGREADAADYYGRAAALATEQQAVAWLDRLQPDAK